MKYEINYIQHQSDKWIIAESGAIVPFSQVVAVVPRIYTGDITAHALLKDAPEVCLGKFESLEDCNEYMIAFIQMGVNPVI